MSHHVPTEPGNPNKLKLKLYGAARITPTGGSVTVINAALGSTEASVIYCGEAGEVVDLRFTGATSYNVEDGLDLTDLEVSELVAVVDYHDIPTNAGTEAGLIRAIERELGL